MIRRSIPILLLGTSLLVAAPLQPKPGPLPADLPKLSPEAEALIRRYRTDDRLEAKISALQSLGRLSEPRLVDIFEREFEKLDATFPEDARLAGVILQAWAARPTAIVLPYLIYEGLFQEDPAVVRACAEGIARMPADARAILSTGRAAPGRDPADEIAVDLISRLIEKPALHHALEKVLVIWSGQSRPGYQAHIDLTQTPDAATRTAGIDYWKKWFEQRFQQKFEPVFEKVEAEKSDEEIHKFLLTDSFKAGHAAHGALVYAALRCNTCHGAGRAGASTTNRLFGPHLSGITKRLSRKELADALVHPSKQIDDSFKTRIITLQDGTVLKGYLTAEEDDTITLAGRAQVRRLDRSKVASIEPGKESLMPPRALNRSSWQDIRDLMKFLEGLENLQLTPASRQ